MKELPRLELRLPRLRLRPSIVGGLIFASAMLPGSPLALPAAAQQEEDAPQQAFVDSVEVEVINIDVYVRDENNEPVTDLEADDFTLEIDGRPVAISNYYRIALEPEPNRSRDRGDLPATVADRRAAPDEPAARDEADSTPLDQRLHVVVYIDNYNLTPFKRNQVLKELRAFLRDELTSADQVMLATYDRELHLRHPFTARPENIARAMLKLEDISAQAIHIQRERTDVLRRLEDVETVTEAIMMARNYAGSVRNDLSFTIDALRSIIDNLAGSPGRKAVIYVSEGLPLIPGHDLFQAIQLKWQEAMSMNEIYEFDMSRRFRELTNQANTNRVSFYTIDAGGLRVLSQATVDVEIAGQAGEATLIDSVNVSNLQSTVQMMAERTGGKAIINTNRFLPDLKQIAEDFRNYYSLGYTIPGTGDGRYHSIEVKLKDKPRGWTIRHRDGYRTKSIETKMHDGTLSALHLDLQNNPLDADLEFGPPQAASANLRTVPVRLRIPFDSLTMLPEPEGSLRGRLRIWFAAKDQDDEMSDVQQIPLEIRIAPSDAAELQGRDYYNVLNLQMEPGYHDIALGIRDELGFRQSFIRRGIQVQ